MTIRAKPMPAACIAVSSLLRPIWLNARRHERSIDMGSTMVTMPGIDTI